VFFPDTLFGPLFSPPAIAPEEGSSVHLLFSLGRKKSGALDDAVSLFEVILGGNIALEGTLVISERGGGAGGDGIQRIRQRALFLGAIAEVEGIACFGFKWFESVNFGFRGLVHEGQSTFQRLFHDGFLVFVADFGSLAVLGHLWLRFCRSGGSIVLWRLSCPWFHGRVAGREGR